jgi:hypothetical protein
MVEPGGEPCVRGGQPGERLGDREHGPWPLISEDMDGEPRWVHPDVTSTRVTHTR